MSKKRKIRVDFQKNRQTRRRRTDVTRQFHDADEHSTDLAASSERVRAKGSLSRKRTIVVDDEEFLAQKDAGIPGVVLSVQGLFCLVVDEQGSAHRCYIRRLLKSLGSDERSVVTVGDHVRFRPAPEGEGLVLRVEPRRSVLTRRYRGQEQTVAANVDQVLIVSACSNPDPKFSLIDRWLVRAESAGLVPIICFNKSDLIDPAPLAMFFGQYGRLGYRAILTSAKSGEGIAELRRLLAHSSTVLLGQSGVGKSSLLNALDPEFSLAVRDVGKLSGKGRHTTTTARLLALKQGGMVIDTPGIRQFELSDVDPDELAGCFPEFRPYLPRCRFSRCRHLENDIECGVVQAVVDRHLSAQRYDSYLRILEGEND
jgi:ribosome biogenesis GTPase